MATRARWGPRVCRCFRVVAKLGRTWKGALASEPRPEGRLRTAEEAAPFWVPSSSSLLLAEEAAPFWVPSSLAARVGRSLAL